MPLGMVLDNNAIFYIVPFPGNFRVYMALMMKTRHVR